MPTRQTSLASDTVVLSGVRLRCPRCKADIDGLACSHCGFRMRICDGIVHALPEDRAAHYKRFLEDYALIRAAEGRGSESERFYLGLPYEDISGSNSRQWQIRARSFDYLVAQALEPLLESGGRILDVGAGNCWMSFRLALTGCEPVAVDVTIDERDGLGAAEHYRRVLPKLFARFRAEMERLPFQDGQFDAVVFNASFHYSEDYEATLREALRCAKRGGLVIIADTPWYSREESGRKMIAERRATFLRLYGTTSNAIEHLEYLTDQRLESLAEALAIRWETCSPRYGFRWAMRPLVANLRRRREPSRFRIYTARKES